MVSPQAPIVVFAMSRELRDDEIRQQQPLDGPDAPMVGICWLPTTYT